MAQLDLAEQVTYMCAHCGGTDVLTDGRAADDPELVGSCEGRVEPWHASRYAEMMPLGGEPEHPWWPEIPFFAGLDFAGEDADLVDEDGLVPCCYTWEPNSPDWILPDEEINEDC